MHPLSLKEGSGLQCRKNTAIFAANNIMPNRNIQDIKSHIPTVLVYARYCAIKNMKIPREIEQALNILEHNYRIPGVISYEGIVLLNDELITLSDEYSEAEAFFYEIHRDIEKNFFTISQYLDNIYKDKEGADELIGNIVSELGNIVKLLAKLGRGLDTETFGVLRPLWVLEDHPRKKSDGTAYPGPSGAFSCGLPYLDIAIGKISPDAENFSMNNAMLPQIPGNNYIAFPDLQDLSKKVRENGNLDDILGEESITPLREAIKRVRMGHMALAKRFVGEALNGAGTGGAPSAKAFLQRHIDNTAGAAGNIL